ncbi:dTMP kinase [Geobacter argillaceus]|uniref:Thymidylate kinase n=1 Tax=Geobacter argillaceus TaxID=345631 RepID=A0A562W816_9BACT|nr:dTMP kinase [Geobacter argillaceus]TWJ26376.1 thymidylate kinase [Geobacter argillaceus]
MTGLFITFEGIEGCGKTTQIRLLAERLEDAGHEVLLTREPGGCPIADQVRAILLDAGNTAMVPLAELLLYAAARAQHVQEVIAPALAAGRTVLCDRFTDATLAYQGYGRGLDRTIIGQLNRLASAGATPDLTILLDCPVEIGLSRAIARNDSRSGVAGEPKEDRFEREARQFHERVREGYLTLARQETGRFVTVDASRGREDTAVDLFSLVSACLTGGRP